MISTLSGSRPAFSAASRTTCTERGTSSAASQLMIAPSPTSPATRSMPRPERGDVDGHGLSRRAREAKAVHGQRLAAEDDALARERPAEDWAISGPRRPTGNGFTTSHVQAGGSSWWKKVS